MAGQETIAMIVDDKAFLKDLENAVKGLKLSTEQELFEMASDVVEKAQEYCPVDNGDLRYSIKTLLKGKTSSGVFVDVGTLMEYAPHVEYGTQEQAPQPYMRPALAWAVGAWGTKYVPSWGVAV